MCLYLSADEVDLGQQTQQISLCARVSLVPLLWTGSVLGFTCYQTGFNQQISSHRPSCVSQTRHIYTSAELISQAFTCHTNQTYLHISRTHLTDLHVTHKPDIFTHQQNSSHRPSRVTQTRHIYTSAELISQTFT